MPKRIRTHAPKRAPKDYRPPSWHERQAEAQRRRDNPSSWSAAYAKAREIRSGERWKNHRLMMLARFPMCQCNECKGERLPATCVHHIKPLAQYPELAYTDSNTVPLFECCHDRIHAEIKKGDRTGNQFSHFREETSE